MDYGIYGIRIYVSEEHGIRRVRVFYTPFEILISFSSCTIFQTKMFTEITLSAFFILSIVCILFTMWLSLSNLIKTLKSIVHHGGHNGLAED